MPKDAGAAFHNFVQNFAENGAKKYIESIRRMGMEASTSLTVSYKDIKSSDADLAGELVKSPKRTIDAMKQTIYDILKNEYPPAAALVDPEDIGVRIIDIDRVVALRKIDTKHLNRLISTYGMVTRASELMPFMTVAAWVCPNGDTTEVTQEDDVFLEKPEKCSACDEKRFKLDREASRYVNSQMITIQEPPDDMPSGETPRSFEAYLFGDEVNVVRPGDRVNITGIIRAVPERGDKGGRSFRTQINANNVEVLDKDPTKAEITKDEEEKIHAIAASPDAYQKLVQSIAPVIYDHADEKEAILLTIAGSPPTILDDGTRLRGTSNVLFVGDPGTSKSELLRFAAAVAPRGMFASGKGSSSAGLTAGIVRGKDGTNTLEAGTIVLADGGVAATDELEKMNPEDRASLHEALEQGSVSIAKAGFHVKLNARTAMISAANPVFGKYNPDLPLTDQINLPPALISRLDLIFVVRDTQDPVQDEKLASHILEVRKKRKYTTDPAVSFSLLRKYLAYCRRVNPVLSDDAMAKIKEFYLRIRKETPMGGIAPTPRTLESLVRLSTARARVLLRSGVTGEDADAAIRLMNRSIYDVAIDRSTGRANYSQMSIGKSPKAISEEETFQKAFKELATKAADGSVAEDEVIDALVKSGVFTDSLARRFFTRKSRDGVVIEAFPGRYRWYGG